MKRSNTGILLVNLGSPDSYEPDDVKVYLREFLMDKRVLDAPNTIRKMIVEGFILPFRPEESAEAYELIWWDEGSPLIVITRQVLKKLKQRLGDSVPVSIGMRYGNPSIEAGVEDLLAQNPDLENIFLIPLYPQYAMATSETVIEKMKEVMLENYPQLKTIIKDPFYDDLLYVKALAESIRPYLTEDIDHLLFSYHGVPERHIKKRDITGDHCLKCEDCCNVNSPAHKFCYRHQDYKTTQNVAEYLNLENQDFSYSVSFQSRLGIDPWIKPSTEEELTRLAEEEGKKKIAVACPAFVSDCIETLEEIGIRGKEDFIEAGGENLVLIPCLNDNELWIDALEKWCSEVVSISVEAA
ncbi:MAG: ferrochelatase [Balneolaceae bacterium]